MTPEHERALAALMARTQQADAAVLAVSELRVAMASLSPPQRRVLELLRLEERSIQEVARALGLTEGNVRVIAHRASSHGGACGRVDVSEHVGDAPARLARLAGDCGRGCRHCFCKRPGGRDRSSSDERSR